MAASRTEEVPEPPGTRRAERARHLDALTGLRGFAALSVVAVHASGRTDLPGVGIHGYGPVSLFVLSGFLLYQPWSRFAIGAGRRPEVGTFARRRVLRIFPAYLAVMLAVAVMLPSSQPNGWDGWLRAFSLTGTYASDGLRPGLEQTWSLGTELTWYLLLPVVGIIGATIARRLTGRSGFYAIVWLMALSIPVTIGWRIWVQVENLGPRFTYSFWLPGFLVCFAAGAAVSHFLEGERAGLVDLSRLRGWFAHSWAVVGIGVVLISIGNSPLAGPLVYQPATFSERQVRFVCAASLAVLLLLTCVLSRPETLVVRLMSTRWLTAIGRWSFGIYLWHLPVIVLLENDFSARTGLVGFLLWMACIYAVSIALGAATYVLIERPAIAWSKGSRRSG